MKKTYLLILAATILIIFGFFLGPKLIYRYDQMSVHNVDTLIRTNILTGESFQLDHETLAWLNEKEATIKNAKESITKLEEEKEKLKKEILNIQTLNGSDFTIKGSEKENKIKYEIELIEEEIKTLNATIQNLNQ